MRKVAMVAALEREVKPLIRTWRYSDREHQGCQFRFFENDSTVLVCGGIGEQAARRQRRALQASVGARHRPEEVVRRPHARRAVALRG